MQFNKLKQIFAAALVCTSLSVHAAPAEIPPQTQAVVDLTGTLSQDVLASLNARMAQFKSHTGAQMAVILTASMNGATIDAYSEQVAQSWHLGDNGAKSILLTVAFTEHGVRLLATRNLADHLDVNRANEIISTVLVPQFRQGHIPQGISGAIDAVEADLTGPAVVASPGMTGQVAQPSRGGPGVTAYASDNGLVRLLSRDTLALGLMIGALVIGAGLFVASRIRSDRALRRSVLRAHAEKNAKAGTGVRLARSSALDKVVQDRPAGLTGTLAKNRLATLREVPNATDTPEPTNESGLTSTNPDASPEQPAG
jgi:uncharacterized membrane protein YgcG